MTGLSFRTSSIRASSFLASLVPSFLGSLLSSFLLSSLDLFCSEGDCAEARSTDKMANRQTISKIRKERSRTRKPCKSRFTAPPSLRTSRSGRAVRTRKDSTTRKGEDKSKSGHFQKVFLE